MTVRTEDTPDPLQLELQEARGTPRQWCWRVYSRRLGRVLWIARDQDAARALLVEGDREVPVLFPDDLDDLRDVDDRRLHARLDELAARKMPAAPGEERT
jgi:hypothetical protein